MQNKGSNIVKRKHTATLQYPLRQKHRHTSTQRNSADSGHDPEFAFSLHRA